jgi:hypothetical protein
MIPKMQTLQKDVNKAKKAKRSKNLCLFVPQNEAKIMRNCLESLPFCMEAKKQNPCEKGDTLLKRSRFNFSIVSFLYFFNV